MSIQFDLTPDMKWYILREHDFYVEQIKQRVFLQFQDMEGDARRYAQAEYERLGNLPGTGDTDMGSIADDAHDHAVEYFGLLSDLRQAVILGALAGLYHQWEKRLRDFAAFELGYSMDRTAAETRVWNWNIGELFGQLEAIGYDVRSRPFFPSIDACRLIVNVYKHGQGTSLRDLHSRYPQYLKDPLTAFPEEMRERFLSHEWLTLTEEEFEKIGKGLRAFWEEFPLRLSDDPTNRLYSLT